MRAVAYLRVSTDRQAEEGVSLDAQRERVAAYCRMRGLELGEVLTEAGVSGGKPLADRPQGRRIAALVEGGVRHVVGLKLDRLFRDTVDALETTRRWDEAGVALHVVDMGGAAIDTSSPMGRMMLTMLAGFAEFERALIRDRTKTALGRKRELGQRTGSIPYGTRLAADGRTLEAHPGERAIVVRARELSAGGLSLAKVADALAGEGMTSRKGTVFMRPQVARMLAAGA